MRTIETKNDDDSAKNIINKQEIKFVQDKLRASLGTKVLLNDNKGKGKINLSYYPDSAKHFATYKAAEKAINDMAYIVQKYGNLEIEEY